MSSLCLKFSMHLGSALVCPRLLKQAERPLSLLPSALIANQCKVRNSVILGTLMCGNHGLHKQLPKVIKPFFKLGFRLQELIEIHAFIVEIGLRQTNGPKPQPL